MKIAEMENFVREYFPDAYCVKSKGKYSNEWEIFVNDNVLLAFSSSGASSCWGEAVFSIRRLKLVNIKELKKWNKKMGIK